VSFANVSPFSAVAVPYIAPDGREVVIAIAKATFRRGNGATMRLDEEQSPVRLGDVTISPDADESSVRYPSDVATEKRGADVVIVGDAVSKRPVTAIDVAVRVRDRTVPLRVHGERVYYRSIGGIVVGPAAPFERKPIVYENAYGGTADDHGIMERRNPVGRGVAKRPADLVDRPAPTIEHPEHPIASASDCPDPAGFGAVPGHWLPRSDFAGTFDELWRATRMPLLPLDFDVRYFNVAHPLLQFAERLQHGDVIAILGMTLDGPFTAELPSLPVVMHGRTDDGRTITMRPPVDTILVEPGKGRVELTTRATFPRGRGRTMLREIRVDIDD
jgi:hypothetical protein